jgi:phosphatidylglycerophosphatase A
MPEFGVFVASLGTYYLMPPDGVAYVVALALGFFLSSYLRRFPAPLSLTISAVLTLLAFPVITLAETTLGYDSSAIVLDEFLAINFLLLLSARVVKQRSPLYSLLAILVFSILDNTKPWLVGTAESLPGAVGVLADDIAAALFALLCLHLISIFLRQT